MNFTELNFLIFFAAFLLIYNFLRSERMRLLFTLLASYTFYAYWNWIYLPMLIGSTLIDFYCGKQIAKGGTTKKFFLIFSLSFNLLLLFVFKYYNFYISVFSSASQVANIVIPVGISFYTFQSMSYTLEVYNDSSKVEEDFGNYALYVSFFPQLVAGPIERAHHLIPQLRMLGALNYGNVREGFQLALFGFFKKTVLADSLGQLVDKFYSNPSGYTGKDTWIAIIAYSFQIYFDFSSYTDIARGIAKILGIHLVENFRLPYFATSLTEFWKRWHISLTSWFKDYVYYPLCLGRFRVNLYAAILIVFLLSGLWHGANWTFVFWGFCHGVILMVEAYIFDNFNVGSKNSFFKIIQIVFNFTLVTLLWVIFRAPDIGTVQIVYKNLFVSGADLLPVKDYFHLLILIPTGLIFDIIFVSDQRYLSLQKFYIRWTWYIFLLMMIGLFGNLVPRQYIYFQF